MIESVTLTQYQEDVLRGRIYSLIVDRMNNKDVLIENPFAFKEKQLVVIDRKFVEEIFNVEFVWVKAIRRLETRITVSIYGRKQTRIGVEDLYSNYLEILFKYVYLKSIEEGNVHDMKWRVLDELNKNNGVELLDLYMVIFEIYSKPTVESRFREVIMTKKGYEKLEKTYKKGFCTVGISGAEKIGTGLYYDCFETKSVTLLPELNFLGLRLKKSVDLEYQDCVEVKGSELNLAHKVFDFLRKEMVKTVANKVNDVLWLNFDMTEEELRKIFW